MGAGVNLYATLATSQSGLTGGTINGLAPNTMQIFGANAGSGTFNSYLDFNVSLYASSSTPAAFSFTNPTSTGTLVGTMEMKLTAWDVLWSSTLPPPAGSSVCYPGSVNCHGVYVVTPIYAANDDLIDPGFYPAAFTEAPEPSTFALFGAGLALFGYSRRKTAVRSKLSAA